MYVVGLGQHLGRSVPLKISRANGRQRTRRHYVIGRRTHEHPKSISRVNHDMWKNSPFENTRKLMMVPRMPHDWPATHPWHNHDMSFFWRVPIAKPSVTYGITTSRTNRCDRSLINGSLFFKLLWCSKRKMTCDYRRLSIFKWDLLTIKHVNIVFPLAHTCTYFRSQLLWQ